MSFPTFQGVCKNVHGFVETHGPVLCSCPIFPALSDYPQKTQVSAHFREFLKNGYQVSAEAIQTKFPVADGTREIVLGTVGINDGFTKIVIMVGIILITHFLET